jgi:ATP-dependent Lhr-like helicase
MFTMLNPRNVQGLLEQAILQVPLFNIRWRWNTTRSLAVLRTLNGKRVPPVLQRFRADDLMSAIFPQQTQCKEHVTGDIELPDHPLVQQTMTDCLYEAIDLPGLKEVLTRMELGHIRLRSIDAREPSPFAYQLLNAMPYAFLDDAPLEERRARAVGLRRTLPMDRLKDLGQLDPEAIAKISQEAWPDIRSADDLYDTLATTIVLPEALATQDPMVASAFRTLWTEERVLRLEVRSTRAEDDSSASFLWASLEHSALLQAAYGDRVVWHPHMPPIPSEETAKWEPEVARLELIRAYLDIKGILDAEAIAQALGLDLADVSASLPAIEGRGDILRGDFRGKGVEWCSRRLLSRMQKLTVEGLRQQIKPASLAEFYTFLLARHHLLPGCQAAGRDGLAQILDQLAGFDAPAGAWEKEILSSRLRDYQPAWLDELTHSGALTWGRLVPPLRNDDSPASRHGMNRVVPIALFPRLDLPWLLPPQRPDVRGTLSQGAQTVLEALEQGGAQFFTDLKQKASLLPEELENALGELARNGLVTADGFSAIRPFVSKTRKGRPSYGGPPSRWAPSPTYSMGGRWALFPGLMSEIPHPERTEKWAWLLLRRYGVVFRDLLGRETASPPWGDLLKIYRSLETRGEIRGGRFVRGPSGEQFALPDAVTALRKVRDMFKEQPWTVIAASDPLNLCGVILPGERIPSSRSLLMVIRGGEVLAIREGSEVTFLKPVSHPEEGHMREALQLSGIFRSRKFQASPPPTPQAYAPKLISQSAFSG